MNNPPKLTPLTLSTGIQAFLSFSGKAHPCPPSPHLVHLLVGIVMFKLRAEIVARSERCEWENEGLTPKCEHSAGVASRSRLSGERDMISNEESKEEEVEKESFAKTCEERASPAGRDFNLLKQILLRILSSSRSLTHDGLS